MNRPMSWLGLSMVVIAGLAAGCGGSAAPVEPNMPVTSASTQPDMPNVVDMSEVDLVEKVAASRKGYRAYLEALQDHYRRNGDYTKYRWTDDELKAVRKVPQHIYLSVADLPSATVVRPEDRIAEADALYTDAMNYYNHFRLPWIYDADKMRVALDKFNQLIRNYPQSDKVDDALFYAAEILKEFFNRNEEAVEYYKRAYEADPKTPHPAHFQRAVILDYRLHQRDKALEEYRKVIEFEIGPIYPKSNSDFAAARIRELTQR